jgi:hypothetical protein
MADRRGTLAVISAGVVGAALATGARASVAPELVQRGWEELVFDKKQPDTFTADGSDGVRVESKGTVSVLHRPVKADLAATPILTWRWRVEAGPPATDLSRKGGDDRALAVYIAFAFDPARAGTFERIKRAAVERLAGKTLPGRVLTYLWGGDKATDWFDNPYLAGAGRMKVLHAADVPLGQWMEERIDLRADFQAAFGYPASAPEEISISSDTDDTHSRALGTVADIRFVAA